LLWTIVFNGKLYGSEMIYETLLKGITGWDMYCTGCICLFSMWGLFMFYLCTEKLVVWQSELLSEFYVLIDELKLFLYPPKITELAFLTNNLLFLFDLALDVFINFLSELTRDKYFFFYPDLLNFLFLALLFFNG